MYLVEPRWRPQAMQTFFQNRDIKYFAVIESNPPRNNSDKMNLLNQMLESAKLKDKEAQLERDIIREESGKTENSPWLDRTDWKRMFPVGCDMKRLIGFANKDVALEPELERVKTSVHRMIENCLESVKDLDDRGWNELRFWLRSHQKDKPDEKPFRKYYVKIKEPNLNSRPL